MLKNKRLFLLDIDGTVCIGKNIIEGAREFLSEIKNRKGKFVFITNNTTKSIEQYIGLFDELGIETDSSNFITASYVTVKYLKERYSGKLIYVLGTKSFIDELVKNDITVTTNCNDENIDCVLVAYNDELTYKGIRDTCKILSTKEVDYIATNPDLVCPIEFGFVPDCGSICKIIGNAVNKTPCFIGKPETAMIDWALKINNFSKDETLVVGDRLYTDILCGYKAEIETALVLTGEASINDADKYNYRPDYIFNSIKDLYDEWK